MIIKDYISELNKQFKTGIAREHSYRPALQQLMSAILTDMIVTNEPARIDCGAPDYIISRKSDNVPVAFVEAKDIEDSDLDGHKQHKSQFNRYKEALDQIIFTDYLDFHFYKNGELEDTIRIAQVEGNKIVGLTANFDKFISKLKSFADSFPQKITSAGKLASIMASKARLLADTINEVLKRENDSTSQQLLGQFEAFKRVLIHDITHESFADVYAQTIAYGIFAARMHDKTTEDFSRQEAATLIPKTNPFLRQIFQSIAGYDLDERIAWIVDDLALSFAATDMPKILKGYGSNSQHSDPMIHFYENFLASYNPKLRKSKGVWYTPTAVVGFIVRSTDEILKRDFNLSNGIADYSEIEHEVINDNYDKKIKGSKTTKIAKYHRVQILDPAVGTGTFLAETINCIYKKFSSNQGMWQGYVEKHLLPRLNGFEILMAPYAIAHLKLDWILNSTGYTHNTDRRIRVYLTNSLEEYHKDIGTLFSMWLSREANEASRIKRDTPVMVIIGNPPYNGSSKNNGEWISELMKSYKKEPGGKDPLKEKNPKWLNDDYVKFIRMAQYFIEQNGEGILAYINPHGFLDNPTFRGMRWELLRAFDSIYTIDLHGNSKKKEVAPDGSKDENVFDIMQGVSINFFIKTGKKKNNALGKLYHFDLYGNREYKYTFLNNNTITTIPYTELKPQAPMYFFVPKNFSLEKEYNSGFAVNELFKVCLLGPNSHRDDFAIAFNKEIAIDRIAKFLDKSISDCEIRELYSIKDNRDWQLSQARTKIKSSDIPINCLYRPFDSRWMLYGDYAFDYPRPQINDQLIKGNNIALITTRQTKEHFGAFVSRLPLGQHKIVTPYDGSYISPLYSFLETDNSLDNDEKSTVPNYRKDIVETIESRISKKIEPMELFDYVYGMLNYPVYINKFKEFLKVDFPRIPYPKNLDEYNRISEIGGKLRKLHVMENSSDWPVSVGYPITGSDLVEKIEYRDYRLYINDNQFFDNIPENVFNYFIGGYQPAQKWLKDRKGQKLTFEDIRHYQEIIYSLSETNKIIEAFK